MSEPNTFIDGCGLFADTPIGEDTRIRFRLAEDRQQDISVFLYKGVLHVYGMYRPLVIVMSGEDNHLGLDTKVWTVNEEVLGNADAGGTSHSDLQLPLRGARTAAFDGGEDQEGLQG